MDRDFIYHNKDGVRRTMLVESSTKFAVKTEVDVTRLVENNKSLSEIHPHGSTNKLVARVPLTIYEKSIHEDWGEGDWKRWLNDSDNDAFRVWRGVV